MQSVLKCISCVYCATYFELHFAIILYIIKSEVIAMENLPKYYITLFNAVSEAIDALDALNFGAARAFLAQGQQEAEDEYLSACEESCRTQ